MDLEKHDPPAVYDSEETLQLSQESRLKMKQLNKEIKRPSYAKINQLSEVFVSQNAKSREELYFSNTSKTASVSKSISIPNEDFSDDTSPKADESLAKNKALEFEIERLLKAVVSQDIMSIVQSNYVVDTLNLQTELDRKSKDTLCVSHTLDPLSQKLEDKNVALEFQVLNYAKENENLKTTYKNLFDSIIVTRDQTKLITDSLQEKLHDTIYEYATLRAHLFDKVSKQKDITKGMSVNTKFANQSTMRKPLLQPLRNHPVVRKPNAFQSERPNFQKLGFLLRINPLKTYREDKFMPIHKARASVGTNRITVSKPHVISQENVNPNSNGIFSTGVESTAKTRRPQPRSNTKNDKVPSASKSSCIENKEVQKFLGTVRFGNDHIATIMGFGDLQWGNILITRVYFVEGLRHNLFSVGQFYDSDLEVAFRRNTCFVKNLEGVDLLKKNYTTNLYTINLHEMDSASPICLMVRATSTKSWLWHQRLSLLNFDTINDLDKNDLVTGLPKFKYHKEHSYPSCEQGKSKTASHPPKPIPNSKKRLHLLYMDLCGPMRVESINGKRYVLVIADDYSLLLQAPVIIVRTNNGTEFKNLVLKEYFDSVGISHQASSVRTPQQNGVVEQRNRTKLDISFLHVFGALCYPKNDREDIGKLSTKGDIGFFIGYSATSCAYKFYNRRAKEILETMNVTFDKILAMAFEQRS
ncbi:retrovirus-related pol polyprotein from transposon TNT 1-94 [Tanacetum coccineum]